MTVYAPEMKITVTNQEALRETFTLYTKDSPTATPVPMDLTGLEFLSQIKKARDISAVALADIQVEPVGTLTDGVVSLYVPEATMRTLKPADVFYDFNIRALGDDGDCLFISDVEILKGVSLWTA